METLRLHLESLAATNDRRYTERFTAQEAAVDKAFAAHDKNTSETLEAQRRAVEAALVAAKEQVVLSLASAQEAVAKAEHATDKRFEQVNAFRSSMADAAASARAAAADQAATFMPRGESISRHEVAAEKINALSSRLDKIEGRSGGIQAGWGYLVGFIVVVNIIVGIIIVISRPS
jgi:hypothetical protein